MNNYIFLVCIVSITFLQGASNDLPAQAFGQVITESAHEWTKSVCQALSINEQVVLANILYLNYITTITEKNCVAKLMAINQQQIAMNSNASDLSFLNKAAVQQMVLLQKLKEHTQSAIDSVPSLQAAHRYVQNSSEDLKDALKKLESMGYSLIIDYAKQDASYIEENIASALQTITSNQHDFSLCASVLQALLDHKNPFKQEDTDENIANIDTAINVSDTMRDIADTLHAGTDQVKKMAIDLLQVQSSLFLICYKSMLHTLHQKNIATPVLFNIGTTEKSAICILPLL